MNQIQYPKPTKWFVASRRAAITGRTNGSAGSTPATSCHRVLDVRKRAQIDAVGCGPAASGALLRAIIADRRSRPRPPAAISLPPSSRRRRRSPRAGVLLQADLVTSPAARPRPSARATPRRARRGGTGRAGTRSPGELRRADSLASRRRVTPRVNQYRNPALQSARGQVAVELQDAGQEVGRDLDRRLPTFQSKASLLDDEDESPGAAPEEDRRRRARDGASDDDVEAPRLHPIRVITSRTILDSGGPAIRNPVERCGRLARVLAWTPRRRETGLQSPMTSRSPRTAADPRDGLPPRARRRRGRGRVDGRRDGVVSA